MTFKSWMRGLLGKNATKESGAFLDAARLEECDKLLNEMAELFNRYRCDLEADCVQKMLRSLKNNDGSFLSLVAGPMVWGGVGSLSDCDLQACGSTVFAARADQKRLKALLAVLGRLLLKSGIRSGRIESLAEMYEEYAAEP